MKVERGVGKTGGGGGGGGGRSDRWKESRRGRKVQKDGRERERGTFRCISVESS